MNKNIYENFFIIAGLYYIIAEACCAVVFNDSLINTYLYHTISELGIPGANSPLFYLMNSAFILVGLIVVLGNFKHLQKYILKNKIMFYLLTLISGVGVIIVGLIHGGNPLTSGYHTLGAVMAILGGNLLLIIVSMSMRKLEKYHRITIFLGIIGLISFWIMFFNMHSIYMPVFERLSVYPIIIWSLITGIYLKSNKYSQ